MYVHQSVAGDWLGVLASSASRWASGSFAMIAAPVAAIARQARINRTARQLEQLDDRTLNDIGLRRTHILSTATQVVDWPHVDPRRLSR